MEPIESLTEEDCRHALDRDPENPAALLRLGLLLLDQPGGQEEAVTLLRRLTQRLPDSAEAWMVLGGSLRLQAGRESEAQACYLRATQLQPESHSAWSGLGFCYGIESPAAEPFFVRATQLMPDLLGTWLHLGQNLLCHRPGDAVSVFRHVVALDGECSAGWFGLSEALPSQSKDRSEALVALETALRLDPQQGDWWDRLGCLYLDELNQPALARKAFETAIGCSNGSPAYSLANLFWTLLSLGCLAEAVQLRSKLYDLDEVGYQLCDAALKLSRQGSGSIDDFLHHGSGREEIAGEYAVDWARLLRLVKSQS